MLEIIYRIYQVEELTSKSGEYTYRDKVELAMDCMITETREDFKNIIRDLYGKNIRFAYSKQLQIGDIYCIIIGEHCWSLNRYFTRYDFECDYCHTLCKSYVDYPIKLDSWDISMKLANQISEYGNKRFCCAQCKDRFLIQETSKIAQETEGSNLWVSRGDFKSNKIAGYIYKITKKSTGEFYIGQTIWEPMFRWAQHLGTDRFSIDNILDYQYETIEIVPYGGNILEREKYWIQKYYNENPKLSLNLMQTGRKVREEDNND